MKVLSTLAFGAIALTTASFATVAPAAANNVGVYAGSNGFLIQVNHRDRYPCWDYWFRRNHPYVCAYGGYYPGGFGFRDRDDWRWRFHHRHHDWDDRRWHDRDHDHDRWRDHDHDRHHDRDRW